MTLLAFLGAVLPASAQSPAVPPGQPLTLADCVRLGLERQPALAAARASLASAETQRQALDKLCLASLISRELPYRRQQACLGVTIAQAGLQMSEYEAIYAITRNFFTVIYARQQEAWHAALGGPSEVSRTTAQARSRRATPMSSSLRWTWTSCRSTSTCINCGWWRPRWASSAYRGPARSHRSGGGLPLDSGR